MPALQEEPDGSPITCHDHGMEKQTPPDMYPLPQDECPGDQQREYPHDSNNYFLISSYD